MIVIIADRTSMEKKGTMKKEPQTEKFRNSQLSRISAHVRLLRILTWLRQGSSQTADRQTGSEINVRHVAAMWGIRSEMKPEGMDVLELIYELWGMVAKLASTKGPHISTAHTLLHLLYTAQTMQTVPSRLRGRRLHASNLILACLTSSCSQLLWETKDHLFMWKMIIQRF